MNIENFKIQVIPEQIKIVQEVLFKNGYKWRNGLETVGGLTHNFIVFDKDDGGLGWQTKDEFFAWPTPEITFEQFKDMYMKETLNTQVGGNHYQGFAIQPIEFIMKNNLSFPVGNIIKYCCRFDKKNGLEDLKKAKHYLEILIENYDTKE